MMFARRTSIVVCVKNWSNILNMLFVSLVFSLRIVHTLMPLASAEHGLILANNISKEVLAENAAIFCNEPVVCNNNRTTSIIVKDNLLLSCCPRCSCDESCHERSDCCFPLYDPFREMQTCLSSAVRFKHPFFPPKYYMTTRCPPKTERLNPEYRDCGNTKVAPWGSLYPVYSPMTGKIYKNHVCADCHDITDGQLWEARIYCESNMLEGNSLPDHCNVLLLLKNSKELLKSETCGDTCSGSENFALPSSAPVMTKQEIIQACFSNFVSIIRESKYYYKNIFCKICNGETRLDCDRGDNLSAGINAKFTWILTHEFELQYKLPSVQDYPKACTTELKQDERDCKRLYCPSTQIYGKQHKCYHVIKNWNIDSYRVFLRINLHKPITIPTIQGYEDLNEWLVSPWPKRWKIDQVFYHNGVYFEKLKGRHLILVMQLYQKKRYDLVLDEIDRLLSRAWYIRNGNETMEAYGEFHKYTLRTAHINQTMYSRLPVWWYVPYKLYGQPVTNSYIKAIDVTPVYQTAGAMEREVTEVDIVITKVHFCPLVSIEGNYTSGILQYNNDILFDLELVAQKHGTYLICYYDSPYKYIQMSNTVMFSSLYNTIQATFISGMLYVFAYC